MADLRVLLTEEPDLVLTFDEEFIGAPYSPTVDVTEIEGGHEVSITSKGASGIKTDVFDVMDGVSPTVSIESTTDEHTVTITDKDGPHEYTVYTYAAQEAARVAAESQRTEAEQARATAESSRASAETARETAWATISAQATSATQAATDAAQTASQAASDANGAAWHASEVATSTDAAERERVTAETARADAETARSNAESARASAESSRVTAEQARASAESSRATAETGRSTAESARDESEQARVTAEQGRATAEQSRAAAESSRAEAEQGRATAESARVTAESTRATEWATIKTEAEGAISAAEDVTEAAESATQAATDAAAEAENVNATITKSGNVATVTVTDRTGTAHTTNLTAGISPIASVERVEGGALVTVTDASGTTTAMLYDAEISEGSVTDAMLVQTGGILGQVDYLSNYFDAGYKRIAGAFVNSSGVVVAGATYDLVCFQITGRDILRNLTSPDALVYAFFTEEPILGSISYNNSRTTFTNIGTVREVTVPSGVSWIAVRVIAGHASPTIVPVIPEIDALSESLDASRVASQSLSYKIGQYSVPSVGYMPSYVNTTNVRFCSESYFLIKKGQTLSVNHSPLSVQLLFCDRDGYYLGQYMSYGKSYTAAEDVYAYAVFKGDSEIVFTSVIDMYAYFPILYYANDSKWIGKTWYSFGTSMGDINPDGVTGNNGIKGKWPLVVDEFSGMTRTNKAIGGGGIVPSATHGGNVKNNIMQCPYDVDLVTFECGLNDWGAITLGEVGDKSNDSFIGNFTQCIEHLTYNTRARIVFISMTPLVFTDYSAGTRRDVFFKNSFGYTYRQYIDAMIEVCHNYGVTVIDAQANAMSNGRLNKYTIMDTTHYSDLGGAMCGRYIWSKLNGILPMPKFPSE